MNKDRMYRGSWFIPGVENTHPGKLRIRKSKKLITLTIYSKTYIDGAPISISFGSNEPITSPPIILGNLDNAPVTLYRCRCIKTNYISDILHEITYSVEFVIELAHFRTEEDIISTKVRAQYPYLASWYDGYMASMKLSADERASQDWNYDIVIDEKVNLGFDDVPREEKKYLLDYYEKHANFKCQDGLMFSEWISYLYKFSRLLELATVKEIPFEIISLDVDVKHTIKVFDGFVNDGFIQCWVTTFLFEKTEVIKSESIHQNSMLFSAWKVSRHVLDRLISVWYSNNDMSAIYDYYIDSNIWPSNDFVITNVMYNNRFLNLIQGLEAYHYQLNEAYHPDNVKFVAERQRIMNMVDRESREWLMSHLVFPRSFKLQDRLSQLILRHKKIIDNLIGDSNYMNFFPNGAKEYRHKLSHGNINKTYQGEQLHALFITAQFLLSLCVMESLKMEEIEVVNALRYNRQIGNISHQIKLAYKEKNSE